MRRQRQRNTVTRPKPNLTTGREPLEYQYSYRSLMPHDVCRVRGIRGEGHFLCLVTNPNNGAVWANVYYKQGGNRSVDPSRIRIPRRKR